MTSSPYWPQRNCKTEAAVKTVKRMMYQKNKDIHLALLDYRNTPQQGQEHSPAQRLLSLRTGGILPIIPALLQPAVAYSGTLKTEIEGRRTRAEHYYDRNWEERPIMQFSHDSGYIQNSILRTNIQLGPMALSSNCPRQGLTLLLSLMERYAEIESRSDWLLLHPLMRRPICPSIQVASQTEQSDPSNYIASPVLPFRLTNGPKPPLNEGLQSPQRKSTNSGNQRRPGKSQSPAITSPHVQNQSTDSAVSEPKNKMPQRSSRVQESSQSTERSINKPYSKMAIILIFFRWYSN